MRTLLLSFLLALAQTNTGTISGKVVNSTGQGFGDVEVLLVGPLTGTAANAAASNPLMIQEIAEGSGLTPLKGRTQADGSFSFPNLAGGSYMLRTEKQGYFATLPLNGRFTTISTTPVLLGSGASVSDVRIALLKDATFSGRVVDASGKPSVDVAVFAYQRTYQEGREMLSEVASRRTNDRGEYRFYGQAPGEYYVAVSPGLSRNMCCKAFYPGVQDVRSAVAVSLKPGDEISGKDISLVSWRGVRVTGAVTKAQPAVMAGVPALSLSSADPNIPYDGSEYYSEASVKPDGTFELRDVPSGSYELSAWLSLPGNNTYLGRSRLEVGNRDIEGVSLTIAAGQEVTVRVFVDGKFVPASAGPRAAPSAGTVRVQWRNRDPRGFLPTGTTSANGLGAFVFPSVAPSLYSVVPVGVPAESYVADIKQGSTSIYDNGLLIEDRPVEPIDIFISSGAQSIRGSVRTAEGRPAVGATVVLVPPPARRKNTQLYKTIRSDASGQFQLSGIPPGDYKLFAWESVPNTAYMNANFMLKYEALGRSVSIPAEGSPTFDLTVISFDK
jgi:hypothetical protein